MAFCAPIGQINSAKWTERHRSVGHAMQLGLIEQTRSTSVPTRQWQAPAKGPAPAHTHGSSWSTHLLDTLSKADRELFPTLRSRPRRDGPVPKHPSRLRAPRRHRPDAVAAEHLGQTISYGELNRQANRLAATLAQHGVKPRDNVALFVRRSIPMLVGILATLKAGAAYVPQDVGVAPAAQLQHIIATASTRVILTLSGVAGAIPVPAGHACIAIDSVMEEPLNGPYDPFQPKHPISSDDGCYVLFTSGTTGAPNGVSVTHRNVCNILLTEPGSLGIRPDWRVSQILNIAFDMAAWEILGCLSHGATLVLRGSGTNR